MTLRDFLNVAKILRRLDHDVLAAAGVIALGNRGAWMAFRSNPIGWLQTYATDAEADALWALVQREMPSIARAA